MKASDIGATSGVGFNSAGRPTDTCIYWPIRCYPKFQDGIYKLLTVSCVHVCRDTMLGTVGRGSNTGKYP